MVTLTCTLKFPDGAEITAEITAASPQSDYPIRYRGAVERLPRRHEFGAPADLQLFFGNLARELGAEVTSKLEGEYERWAE